VVGGSLVLPRSSGTPELGRSDISGPMPAIAGATLDGGSITPADYQGQVVVVNFWAAWCAPCRVEQPFLQRLHESYDERGVAFLGVDLRDDPAAARAHIDEFEVTYPSVEDPAGTLTGTDFGLLGIPATVVADRSGEMRYLFLGGVNEEELRDAIDDLTAQRS
jgi:cytochrome c biogenesis protein CcmG, thiol:disulfide interchange protein DsbE